MGLKLGFGERKVTAPGNPQELIGLLSQLMASAVNNEVDLDNARVALNAATRIVDVWQADTRMKALAISYGKTIVNADGWQTIETEPKQLEEA